MTNIDYPDGYFDVVYCCEALEHAVDIRSAIREMTRVTKSDGKLLIIDKNNAELGRLEICEWEVWFDAEELKEIMLAGCSDVQVTEKIDYDNEKDDTLFLAWTGTVI